MIIDFGDIEYILTSDPTPTGRDREWKASATIIDGHPVDYRWMATRNSGHKTDYVKIRNSENGE